MNLEEKVYYSELFTIYQHLLATSQQNIFQLAFLEDYSYTEISEILGISKQAIADAIKKSKQSLDKFESFLNIYHNNLARNKIYQKILEQYPNLETEIENLKKI